jgi:hypothetical protein
VDALSRLVREVELAGDRTMARCRAFLTWPLLSELRLIRDSPRLTGSREVVHDRPRLVKRRWATLGSDPLRINQVVR